MAKRIPAPQVFKKNGKNCKHTPSSYQGCIFRLTCSHPELTDHVLTSAYVKIFRTVTRNAVNKSV